MLTWKKNAHFFNNERSIYSPLIRQAIYVCRCIYWPVCVSDYFKTRHSLEMGHFENSRFLSAGSSEARSSRNHLYFHLRTSMDRGVV